MQTLPRTDLFSDLDDAQVVAQFATITGDIELRDAAETDIRRLSADASSRGYILGVHNCEHGDLVQNLYGDTGTITALSAGAVTVRWDAPTTHTNHFGAIALLTGALRHRN